MLLVRADEALDLAQPLIGFGDLIPQRLELRPRLVPAALGIRNGLPDLLQRITVGGDRFAQLLQLASARFHLLPQGRQVLLVRADGALDLAQSLLGFGDLIPQRLELRPRLVPARLSVRDGLADLHQRVAIGHDGVA